ncbi:MAG: AAA family ATPase [Candidatus Sumerlaeia bacterium]|nr:AAA family ATPase [Candidatus Sumerlaeia bacterium]
MAHATTEHANVVELVDGFSRPRNQARFAEASSDPLLHFGLTTNPFADNVNPQFFFRTEAHEEAFILMKKAVEDDASLALCTALSGTGKTLLTQILLQDLDTHHHRTILTLVYPGMSRTALLRDILGELGLDPPAGRTSIHAMLSQIQQEIIRLHACGQKLVLIIDEAHFLKPDSLHILRTLSNIEVPEKKLISVLLFGEDHFRDRLDLPSFKAVLSRMVFRCTLRPLNAEEVEQYIKFRCLMAGGRADLFETSAIEPICRATRGVPREINRLAHNGLLAAARTERQQVNGEIIEALTRVHQPS